jgi:hypothetical protein
MLVDYDGRMSAEVGGSEGQEVNITIVLYLPLFFMVSRITRLRFSF